MTIYTRLQEFYGQGNTIPLSQLQRNELGTLIASAINNLKGGKGKFPKTRSHEDIGTFSVNNYPDDYTSIIDAEIKKFHDKTFAPPQAKRERIRIKPKPVLVTSSGKQTLT